MHFGFIILCYSIYWTNAGIMLNIKGIWQHVSRWSMYHTIMLVYTYRSHACSSLAYRCPFVVLCLQMHKLQCLISLNYSVKSLEHLRIDIGIDILLKKLCHDIHRDGDSEIRAYGLMMQVLCCFNRRLFTFKTAVLTFHYVRLIKHITWISHNWPFVIQNTHQ